MNWKKNPPWFLYIKLKNKDMQTKGPQTIEKGFCGYLTSIIPPLVQLEEATSRKEFAALGTWHKVKLGSKWSVSIKIAFRKQCLSLTYFKKVFILIFSWLLEKLQVDWQLRGKQLLNVSPLFLILASSPWFKSLKNFVWKSSMFFLPDGSNEGTSSDGSFRFFCSKIWLLC